MTLYRFATALGLAGLLMFAYPAAAQEPIATPEVQPSSDQFNLNHVVGDGYSLLVPANAVVKVGTKGNVGVIGPEVDIRDADGNRYHDNAYALFIKVYNNPDHLTADAYATRAAEALWKRAKAENVPTGGLPALVDGQIAAEDSAHLTVDGEPAFEVTYNAFDASDTRIYVAQGDKSFFINYEDASENDTPLGQVQQAIYALMLATLQFEP